MTPPQHFTYPLYPLYLMSRSWCAPCEPGTEAHRRKGESQTHCCALLVFTQPPRLTPPRPAPSPLPPSQQNLLLHVKENHLRKVREGTENCSTSIALTLGTPTFVASEENRGTLFTHHRCRTKGRFGRIQISAYFRKPLLLL